ncbi:MAG: HAD family phosphatase [Chitinophagales bacterium]|nr:HAD family phosphatase [Chitinophagales bacterium]MDW8273382.1 HAD family phosphatase [Chitinophagales bacterium]
MLKPPFESICNIIFDVGDVLIDIDYQATISAFQKLAIIDFSTIISYARQHSIFDYLEKGLIDPAQFRNELRRFLRADVTDEQIDQAWNSILVNYPEEKFSLLQKLKKHYRIYALSNINQIHLDCIDNEVSKRFGVQRFEDFFHKAYYSHLTGYRKPEAEIYELVLQEQLLIPQETLFIDDKAENIAAAAALGIQTYHLTDRKTLIDLFNL